MVEPTIIVAIITAASLIYTSTIKVVSDQLGNHKKTDKSEENALSPQSVSAAVSSPNLLEQKVRQSLARKMDRMEMDAKSLDRRTIIIRAEGFELDKRADEAVNTYGTNVLVIMLFHGLGSIFLQLNYPYSGTSVSVLMVVSFFSTFVIAYIVSSNNIEKMSQLEKDLRRRQSELQNDIAYFGAEIQRAYPDEDFKTLARIGAIGEVWNRNGSLTRDAQALQSGIARLLEMSSNSESNRIKLLFQVKVWAIMYGLSFPMMACYLLHFIDFRRKRFVY